MKPIWLLIIFAVASPPLIPAQNSKPTQKSIELQGKLEEKQNQDDLKRVEAVNLVERTAAEAPLWDNKKMAVEVLADAADLLWDETPGQGAKWLTIAWSLIDQVSESPKNDKLKDFFNRSGRAELQTAVLSVARRHDLRLAERFLKQLAEKKPDEKKDRGAFDDRTARSEQLLRLAQEAVEADPELAFSLAERSLAEGLSYGLQDILTSLRKKNVDLANRLFDLALATFANSTSDPSEAEVLAGYLFQSGFTFSVNSSGQTILVVNPAQQNLPAVASSEPRRTKTFLVAVYQSLLARPVSIDTDEGKLRAQRTLVLGNRILGRYYTFAPEFAQATQGFLAHLQRQLSPGGDSGPFSGSTQTASRSESTTKPLTKEEIYEKHLADLEDRADKENNPIARKLAYVEAALATKPEDHNRAKRIVEKIDDDELRADAGSFVLYRAALSFVENAEVEKAIEIAPQISEASRRAVVKIAIAQSLVATKRQKTALGELSLEQQRAFDLLNDIERDLKKEEPSANLVKILLGRIAVLANLDTDQALASVEQVVQMINKLNQFDLRDGAAPDLGLGVSATSSATVARPRIGFDFRSAIEPLVTTSLEQIAAAAERLTPKELSGVGRLEVAKLYLKEHGEPPARGSSRVIR